MEDEEEGEGGDDEGVDPADLEYNYDVEEWVSQGGGGRGEGRGRTKWISQFSRTWRVCFFKRGKTRGE